MAAPYYYQHVYPGQAMVHPGDRRVSESMRGMETPHYKKFETAHDSYLGVAALNLFLLIATVTVFTHLGMVLINQKSLTSSTIADILNGPMLLIVVAGLAGVGLVFGHMGVSQNLYYSLYIPFGLVVIGTAIWSIFNDREVNAFTVTGFSELVEFAPETMMWVGIAVLVALATISQWVNGRYRLDAMSGGGIPTFLIVIVTMFFTYGLSRVFALVLKTMDFAGMDSESPSYMATYALISVGMVILVISAIKFLDISLHFFGGHMGSIFAPPSGVGASKAIIETQRAFQIGIYTIILLSAALMWRRRNGLEMDKMEDGEVLKMSWAGVIAMIIFVPVLAMVSEAMKEWFDTYSPVYDLIRAILLSAVLVFVGIGYIPWNYITLGIAGVIMIYMVLRHVEINENYDKPLAALVITATFIFSRMVFRSSDLEAYKTEGTESGASRWMRWVQWVGSGAAILLLLSSLSDGYVGSYADHMTRIYFGFVVVYTLSLTFVDSNEQMPMRDSPFYDMVPENEAASMAIDGIILMACLMTTTAIWGVIAPKNISRGHEFGGFGGLGYKDLQIVPGFKVNILTLLYYGGIGAACAYMYVNIRHDRALSAFARNAQQRSEEWYTKIGQDSKKI
jgi:hypothetical protein